MTRPGNEKLSPEAIEYIAYLEGRLDGNEKRIQDLELMLQNMQRMLFGKRSEKAVPQVPESAGEQLNIFDEAEASADPTAPDESNPEVIEVVAHKRTKTSRKTKFAEFPKVITIADLADENKNCDRCGEKLEKIGKELVRTEYEFVPAHIEQHEYYRSIYSCSHCESGMPECEDCKFASDATCASCAKRPKKQFKKANLPAQLRHPLLKHSLISPSTFSQVVYAKYVQATPLERQVKDWERLGFPMSKTTLSNWILEVDREYGRVLVGYMHKELLKQRLIHCDETPTQVLHEGETKTPKKCYMWVFRSGEREKRQIVIFDYQPSRSGDCATEFLAGYNEYFVADGYSGYNKVGGEKRCGCWIHCRRGFIDASPDKKMQTPGKAKTGYDFCNELIHAFNQLEDLDREARQIQHRVACKPILDRFFSWCDEVNTFGNKKLTEAVNYARNQKDALCRFLEDPDIPLQNNRAENAIRPFVVGRKNWLFHNTANGAVASADMYSIVETAKANNLDVYKYLNYLFRWITVANHEFTNEFLESLMPWGDKAQEICKRSDV